MGVNKKNCIDAIACSCLILICACGALLVVTAIGWGVCSDITYCSDPNYSYRHTLENSPERTVYTCCTDASYSVCSDAGLASRRCVYYNTWMWVFLSSIFGAVFFGLILLLVCLCSYEEKPDNNTEDDKKIEVSTVQLAEIK